MKDLELKDSYIIRNKTLIYNNKYSKLIRDINNRVKLGKFKVEINYLHNEHALKEILQKKGYIISEYSSGNICYVSW